MSKLIYIAEDDAHIRKLVKAFLENDGHTVQDFDTGDALFTAFKQKESHLVILDIMMPGTDGLTLCAQIRAMSTVPILMLTAKDTEADYISGLVFGSDDYFTKPFSPTKLAMRVKAMFRRQDMNTQGVENAFGDLTLSRTHLTVSVGDTPLSLTKTEYNLLLFMIEKGGVPLSRQDMLQQVWGFENEVETRATDDTIKRLRKKLTEAQSSVQIETVYGYGFKLTHKAEAPYDPKS